MLLSQHEVGQHILATSAWVWKGVWLSHDDAQLSDATCKSCNFCPQQVLLCQDARDVRLAHHPVYTSHHVGLDHVLVEGTFQLQVDSKTAQSGSHENHCNKCMQQQEQLSSSSSRWGNNNSRRAA